MPLGNLFPLLMLCCCDCFARKGNSNKQTLCHCSGNLCCLRLTNFSSISFFQSAGGTRPSLLWFVHWERCCVQCSVCDVCHSVDTRYIYILNHNGRECDTGDLHTRTVVCCCGTQLNLTQLGSCSAFRDSYMTSNA